jgi:hypothetical protein
VHGDARSRRMAVVPDEVVNGTPGGDERLSALVADGWGIVALGPADLVQEARDGWLDAIVDQVVTFLDDDYEVAIISPDDPESRRFVRALARHGRAVTREIDPASPSRPETR